MGFIESREEFIKMLDQEHQWPTWYMFKFIVPRGNEHELVALFPEGEASVRASSKGKYRSVTSKVMMSSADDVLDIYEKARQIEGVLAL
jgi:putative lipoic acid-binding regulatory protein